MVILADSASPKSSSGGLGASTERGRLSDDLKHPTRACAALATTSTNPTHACESSANIRVLPAFVVRFCVEDGIKGELFEKIEVELGKARFPTA